jgi:hypothetical protein
MPNTTEINQNATSAAVQAGEPPKTEIRDHITRADVRADKDKIFLFGDNLTGKGYGGQAKEMRGEENAVGIPTKKFPNNNPSAFFNDKELAANKKAIDKAFSRIPTGKIIVMPRAGLGTGLAQLSEKAPRTFAYLNDKLVEIGFNNQSKETAKTIASKSADENKVVVQSMSGESRTAKRLLDLDNIQTAGLKNLSPTEKEIVALKIDSRQALTDYADRLRTDYKTNKDNFRAGLKLLSDSLEKGEQITVTCSCRNGAMCHADVVKMAIEKVNAHIKNTSVQEMNKSEKAENPSAVQNNSKINSNQREQDLNPRSQRAINEILSFSANDRVLEKIGETDGRNRSEQASYLGRASQFIRDIYERGANVVDGKLIIPQEKLTISEPLKITTESYAVKKIGDILRNESKAKEIAPVIVEYGNKIAGATSDGETKLKVFGWMYDSLEGKSEFQVRDENNSLGEKAKFEETLEKIGKLAEEMHSLEPLDKIEFVPLAGIEQVYSGESSIDTKGENLNLQEIYEEAISREENEKIDSYLNKQFTPEQAEVIEPNGSIFTEGYERIDLRAEIPQIPKDFTNAEIAILLNETLPAIDRKLENGVSPKEILAPFNEIVRQSAKDDANKRLETIYQKQEISRKNVNQLDSGKSVEQQLAKIDLRRQNVIELRNPSEYLSAEKEAVNTFYRQQIQQVGTLLEKIDEVREKQQNSNDKTEEITFKKELTQIREAKPNFAFKLENSAELVIGTPSEESIQTRNFVSSYISYQLKQPESRLRFENERYRVYAARLESAANRADVMKSASRIRAENTALGIKWKDLAKGEKENFPRPLSQKEMQFLFTETSPAHYTNEMTAVRLSYAHIGASRRAMTESLVKGEISPSPEAQKLIVSLESRLQRREINDSLLATKHFFESIKTPNESLKYKNKFDHKEIYQKLPPQEKDFVYFVATHQKENLEYRLAFKSEQFKIETQLNRLEPQKSQTSQAEKSFHLFSQFNQARVLGAKVETPTFTHQEINERDAAAIVVLLKNQPNEKLEAIGQELHRTESLENKKIGEVLRSFASAEIFKDENKTTVSIKLPENKLVETETYRELLEKFYPDDARENAKYKFEDFGEKEVSRALKLGQDEAIQNLREDIKGNVYQPDTTEKIQETQTAVLEKIDKITHFQSEARNARRENESIVHKYVALTDAKLQNQNQQVPPINDQKEIVELTLGKNSGVFPAGKESDRFLRAVQKEITISDLQKFTANEQFLGEVKFNIKNEFAEISRDLSVLEESKVKITPENDRNLNQILDKNWVSLTEDKPLSQQIFEKETEKAEKQLLTETLNEKLSGKSELEKEKIQNPATIFSAQEREEIKIKAGEIAKERLEPKELNADHRKISSDSGKQALTTFKQLERAANVFQFSNDSNKIREAFVKLDVEAAALNKIRQDYGKSEKLALLREGIKADIIDLFSKNSDRKTGNFSELTKEIVGKNFYKAGFAGDSEQIVKICREIGEKLEAKHLFASKEKQNFFFSESKETKTSGKISEVAAEKLKPKYEQTKELFVRSR